MFGLRIFVWVQTFRRGPPMPPHNFCHPGISYYLVINRYFKMWAKYDIVVHCWEVEVKCGSGDFGGGRLEIPRFEAWWLSQRIPQKISFHFVGSKQPEYIWLKPPQRCRQRQHITFRDIISKNLSSRLILNERYCIVRLPATKWIR